jgi:hypothetical protein
MAVLVPGARGSIIQQWTFESNSSAVTGQSSANISPETGSGTGIFLFGHHADASSAYSTSSGNGSSKSETVTRWASGDYWQFDVPGTTGLQVMWDETSSNTGPRDFILQYSTDNGSTFSTAMSYSISSAISFSAGTMLTTMPPRFSYDFTGNTAVETASNDIFRLTVASAVSGNGGAIGTAGTSRIDNVTVGTNIIPVPEPTACGLMFVGCAMFGIRARKRVPIPVH